MPSSSLQIPPADIASSSNHSSRPASVAVNSTSSPTSPARKQRASHTVTSQPQSNQLQHHHDDTPPYQDVYSHPAAVAYAAAHPRRTIPKFGPYLLLQTLGEGEFGKVKLGLHSQWGEEVAVKLIRRGNVDNSVRMSKVEREIEVLRTLKHPNIVRLYDVIETDKYIGIILEYASGGELFDHILAHRYLKEKDAAKLFSQLISGVWYIHQKKIVHRDLKLENLLLDRHRNVIITDFGFANRFEHRSDDLMQTSCGSPCYAAPELVISEGLYVGSAVDIWSCGVILYAMLAGYLPFDDDPANPDGDNINLLYKYIVNTPLSFPEYISDEARDLLSMMLVPDPARRSDLEGVMRHPWLSAYAHPSISGVSSAFGKTVDELEKAAMEQHQLKRIAYQRQMKAAAAAASPTALLAPTSYNQPPIMSQKSRSAQPEYLYETSTSRASPLQQPVLAAMDDDDPFAPVSVSASTKTRSPAGPPPSSGGKKSTAASADRFRHTIQVEYDEPSPSHTRSGSAGGSGRKESEDRERRSGRERADSRTRDRETPVPVSSPPRTRERSNSQAASVNATTASPISTEKRRPSQSSGSSKPLPAAPSSSTTKTPPSTIAQRSNSVSSSSSPQKSAPPIVIKSASPPATPVASADAADTSKDKDTGSSKGSSRHRKGMSSIDKMGLGKIFGANANEVNANVNANGTTSRMPSDSSASAALLTDSASSGSPSVRDKEKEREKERDRPSTLQVGPSSASASLLSPSGGEKDAAVTPGKKSRRNTLTVMVEPISRSIKNRTNKGRLASATTPTAAVSASGFDAEKEKERKAPPSAYLSPTTPPVRGAEGEGRTKERATPTFGNVSRTDIAGGMQASTSKARKVMAWFRTKNKGGRESVGLEPSSGGEEQDSEREKEKERDRGVTPTQAQYRSKPSASSGTVNQSTAYSPSSPVQVFVTTPTSATHRSPSVVVHATSHPKRSASSATDTSFSPPSIIDRIRNSVTVGGDSGSGPTSTAGAHSVGGALRIHHGAVDQTTITTRPPPEVMKHVRDVLEGMGVEIQVESDYKYRCIRAKRRKASGVGLGSLGPAPGASGSLAAFNMSGSAASNGVDRRGLPVPSQPSFHDTKAGGMLRGLLMRRQSSQVSGIASASQPSLSFDDDTPNNTFVVEPSTMAVYGDPATDAGDEVRFSVELTRLDRLNDTFSLDIRRLKGNLRSYKFLYDTLRGRADLQR